MLKHFSFFSLLVILFISFLLLTFWQYFRKIYDKLRYKMEQYITILIYCWDAKGNLFLCVHIFARGLCVSDARLKKDDIRQSCAAWWFLCEKCVKRTEFLSRLSDSHEKYAVKKTDKASDTEGKRKIGMKNVQTTGENNVTEMLNSEDLCRIYLVLIFSCSLDVCSNSFFLVRCYNTHILCQI